MVTYKSAQFYAIVWSNTSDIQKYFRHSEIGRDTSFAFESPDE